MKVQNRQKLRLKKDLKQKIQNMQSKGQNLNDLKGQNFRNSNFSHANNFQGRVIKQKIVGKAFFFKKIQNINNDGSTMLSVFFGQVNHQTNQRKGIGIELRLYGNELQNSELQVQKSQTLFLQDWQNLGQQNQGFFIQQNEDKKITAQFSGKLQYIGGKVLFLKGKYQTYHLSIPKTLYTGKFFKNKFHGQGQLLIFNKSKFKGTFDQYGRDGFGIQEDYLNKTIYYGNFQSDKKQGYGKLVYLQKDIQLRGFWEEGIVKQKQGLYMNSNGQVIDIVSDFF